MDEERISQRILYVIVALIAVVFMAFYLVGFNEPLASDPAFNAPLLTDVLIGFMWFLLVLAVVAALVAMVKGLRIGLFEGNDGQRSTLHRCFLVACNRYVRQYLIVTSGHSSWCCDLWSNPLL